MTVVLLVTREGFVEVDAAAGIDELGVCGAVFAYSFAVCGDVVGGGVGGVFHGVVFV